MSPETAEKIKRLLKKECEEAWISHTVDFLIEGGEKLFNQICTSENRLLFSFAWMDGVTKGLAISERIQDARPLV